MTVAVIDLWTCWWLLLFATDRVDEIYQKSQHVWLVK